MTHEEASQKIADLWGDALLTSQWMRSPQPFLDGETPDAAMATESGRERVVTRLVQLAYGVYV